MGSLRVGHDWSTSLSLFTFMHWRRKWQPTPVFLPGKSHGQRSLVGCSPFVTKSQARLSDQHLLTYTIVEVMKIIATSFKCSPVCIATLGALKCPQLCSRPPPTQASAGDSWTLTGKLGHSLVGSLLLSPGSWCAQGSVCALQSVAYMCAFIWEYNKYVARVAWHSFH